MACLSLWPLFTVVQGYRKGLIEPFARGFYNTYEREGGPRFWASMGWNALLGAFSMGRARGYKERTAAGAEQHMQ